MTRVLRSPRHIIRFPYRFTCHSPVARPVIGSQNQRACTSDPLISDTSDGRSLCLQKLLSSTEVDIPSAIYTGTVADLYAFIAAQVVTFARKHGITSSSSGSDATTHLAGADADATPTTPADLKPSPSAVAAPPVSTPQPQHTPTAEPHPDDEAGPAGAQQAAAAPAGDQQDTAAGGAGPSGGGNSDRGGDPAPAGADDLGDWADVAADRAGGAAEASDGTFFPPLGFCFSFPMVQSGLATCGLRSPGAGRALPRPSAAPVAAFCSRETSVIRLMALVCKHVELASTVLATRGWLGVAALTNLGTKRPRSAGR